LTCGQGHSNTAAVLETDATGDTSSEIVLVHWV
jgi:hypothetical protein